MVYAGLPDDAVVFQGLPEGAKITSMPPSEKGYIEVNADGNDSMSAAERMDNPFFGIDTPEKLREEVKITTRKKLADFARPTVEGVGMALGSIAGLALAPETLGLSVPAGAAGGYALSKGLMDIAEGKPAEENLLKQFAATGKDFVTGAELEAMGMGAGKAIGAVGRPILNKLYIPTAKRAADRRAAKILSDFEKTVDPKQAEQYAANQIESQRLAQEGNLPYPFTPGQATNNKTLGGMEKSFTAKDGAFGEQLRFRNTENALQAGRDLERKLGVGFPIPEVQNADITGNNTRNFFNEAVGTSKNNVSSLYSDIPDYVHPTEDFTSTYAALKKRYLNKDAQEALDEMMSMFNERPKTTKNLIALDQDLGDAIKQAERQGKTRVSKVLGQLKVGNGELKGLRGDFNAMGEAAQAGDVALFEGKLVRPSELQADIAKNQARIDLEAPKGLTQSEQNKHLYEALVEAKYGSGISDGVNSPVDAQTKALKDALGVMQRKGKMLDYQPPAPTSGVNQAIVDDLNAGIAAKQNMLGNLTPAEDVAAKYSVAHSAAKEHFAKYGKSDIKNIIKSGDRIGNGALSQETVPEALFTREGAKQSVAAIGAQNASVLATPHLENLLFHPTKGAMNNGILDINKALKIVDNHADAIGTLGLNNHAIQLIKDQVPATLKAELEAFRTYNIDNPVQTAAAASQWARKYGPAMKRLYGSNGPAKALVEYARINQILARNKNVAYAPGSDTIANLYGDVSEKSPAGRMFSALGTVIAGSGLGYMLHGAAGATGGAIIGQSLNMGVKEMNAISRDATIKVLKSAITNPEHAYFLKKLRDGVKVTPTEIENVLKSVLGRGITATAAPKVISPLLGTIGDNQQQ